MFILAAGTFRTKYLRLQDCNTVSDWIPRIGRFLAWLARERSTTAAIGVKPSCLWSIHARVTFVYISDT
jgi:hypothetical protein